MTDSTPSLYPVLPLRDIVVFPGMIVPLFVGREKSIKALEEVIKGGKELLLLTQKDAQKDDPEQKDLYTVGTIAHLLQLLKLPDGTVKVLVEARHRVQASRITAEGGHYAAHAKDITETEGNPLKVKALTRSITQQFEQYIKINKKINPEVATTLPDTNTPGKLADAVASHLALSIKDKQKTLELVNIEKRLEHIYTQLESEMGVLNTERKIRSRVKKQVEKTQKEYYLNEQLKAIQKELGEGDDGKDDLTDLEERIKNSKMSTEAQERAQAELKKLRNMSPMSAESTVIRNYLDWLVSLPWNNPSDVVVDIQEAQKVLDHDHYGLEKVKERITEYLAVQQRTQKLKGPIICLVGPPGVGKTSLAKSIAEATGRNFVRISLGGIRDEAEIRGHRRTYIGSMPGKIIQSMKKAKSSNPLFLLDEVDKIGLDFRGDPASALLEVLDPEQNATFADHYLEVEYDLSNVMFIATANTLNIPRPLLDRMEIIRISGYTEEEKIEIAKRHLIGKQREAHGLEENEWSVSDEALRDIIRYYTRESGVRNMERELANLARKSIKDILLQKNDHITITTRNLGKYAGVQRFNYNEAENNDLIGVTTGLAYTEVGGELLSIEALSLPGKGTIKTTGKLGDVMQESAQAAFSYMRSRSLDFGITPPEYQKKDIHLHVPEGATPKDGPSAGIAMYTSIVSVMSGIPVKKTVAMTGEITLRGRVLPIGGLKEKLLAALRGGIKTVVIPKENAKDLIDIPLNIKRGLDIIPVSFAEEVLKIALTKPLTPIDWQPEAETLVSPAHIPQSNKDEGAKDEIRPH